MDYKNLTVETREKIGWVTLSRPKALNALNTETLTELETAIDDFYKNKGILAVVITGDGKAFVAGADISEMQHMNVGEADAYVQKGHRVFSKIEKLAVPVIAAINGFALGGGCELALACDIRIASEKAKLGLPEVGLGVIPGFGGTQRLSRICGIAKAKELIFSAEMIDAAAAEKIGLVNRVVPPEDLISAVESLAEKIAGNGPIAIRKAKRAINRGFDTDLASGCSYEIEKFGECFLTNQPKEGMSAFLEKRKAEW